MKLAQYLYAMLCGFIATATMDVLNYLGALSGLIGQMDHSITGRLADGWISGRFVYDNFAQVPEVQHAFTKGIFAHYFIGIVCAGGFLYLSYRWRLRRGLGLAIIFGLATSVFSLLLLFPSVGLGAFAMNAPHGSMLVRSSLFNHLFYGIGLFIGMRLWCLKTAGQSALEGQQPGSIANAE